MFSAKDISLSGVRFSQLEGGQIYMFNPQYVGLPGAPKHHKRFFSRLGCIMEVDGIASNAGWAQDHADLECLNPTKRRQHASHSPTTISRVDLDLGGRSINGNLLVRLHAAVCHSCGKYRDHCWRNYTGHYLCPQCRKAGKSKPPFPFGFGEGQCCSVSGCGTREVPFQGGEGEAVLRRALLIYERYQGR